MNRNHIYLQIIMVVTTPPMSMGWFWYYRNGKTPSLPGTIILQATYPTHVMYSDKITPSRTTYHTRWRVSSTSATIKWWGNWVTMPDLHIIISRFSANHQSLHAETLVRGRSHQTQGHPNVTNTPPKVTRTTKKTYEKTSS